MKGKLQKSWVLSSIVLIGLTTTLPSVNMVLAETVNETQNTETQDVNLPYDNLLETPTSESSDTQEEPTVEEQPTFSLENDAMMGTVGETTDLVILVDRPTAQVQVTIPQELTVQKDELAEWLEATQMTETEWWFSADECTQFTIPVSSETAGDFTICVEDELDGTIIFEEATDDGTNDELVVTDETDSTNDQEDNVLQEVQDEEETPTQETEDITPATTSNVSTWAQYRTAINTASVTEINVLANISGNTTLNNLTRNLTINGNGFTINSQNQTYTYTTSNRQLIVRDATIQSSLTGTNALFRASVGGITFVFSDIHFTGSGRLSGNTTAMNDANTTVIFDGGENKFSGTLGNEALIVGIRTVTLRNNSTVNTGGNRFNSALTSNSASHKNQMKLSIEKGSALVSDSIIPYTGSFIQAITVDIQGIVDAVATGNFFSIPSGITQETQLNIGEEARVRAESAASSIANNSTNMNVIIAKGAEFDLISSVGGPIINSSQTNNIQIATENLAVWNRGRTSSTPSQNFENIEVQLTGPNAATITSTNHNVFRATYSKQGLNGYSRISSSGLAGETPVDPLEPDAEIDPDNPPVIPENQGNFRLDFVSQFTFGSHERNMFEEEIYYALPQYGLDSNGEVIESEPKPNFVQITDNRADADG